MVHQHGERAVAVVEGAEPIRNTGHAVPGHRVTGGEDARRDGPGYLANKERGLRARWSLHGAWSLCSRACAEACHQRDHTDRSCRFSHQPSPWADIAALVDRTLPRSLNGELTQ